MDEVIRVVVFLQSVGQLFLQAHSHEGTKLDQQIVGRTLAVLPPDSTVPQYPFEIVVDESSLEVGELRPHILIDGEPSGIGNMRESAFTGRSVES